MGRGGGKVQGAKSSQTRAASSSSTSVTVSGEVDPKILGLGLAILGVVFMICTIAVPVSMVANPSGTPCSSADSLNRNEQAVCYPGEKADEDFLVEYEKKGDGYVKAYRAKKSQLENNNKTRTYIWENYKMQLSGSYDYFSFSVPVSVSGYLNVFCDEWRKNDKCNKVKMWFLSKEKFDSAINEYGEFDEDAFKKADKGFDSTGSQYYFWANTPGQYVLAFALTKEKPTYVSYDIALRYNVFETKDMEEVECKKGECKIKDVKDDEVVIADFVVPDDELCKELEEYPELGKVCYDECTNPQEYVCGGKFHAAQPEYFDIKIHDLDINWSGVAAAAVIFALLTLVCFGLAALFLYKFLKKIGKLGKKVAKKIEKMEEEKNSTQMDAVPAQPVQADPSYAAGQPYPGQPVDPSYAAAPYPGQPM